MAKRKAKEITEQEWQEIIAYAQSNTITAAAVKYNIYADSIKYKIDPEMREKKKSAANKKYADIKADPEKWAERQNYNKQTYNNNIVSRSEYHKKWLQENWKERQEYSQNYYNDNKIELRLKGIKKYQEIKANPNQYNELLLQQAEKRKIYRTTEYKEQYNAQCRERYKNDICYRMKSFIYGSIHRCLKACGCSNKTMHSNDYLGCTPQQFKEYIESKFQPGMSWDNYGLWEIDHILPINLMTPNHDIDEQLLFLCNYKNCRPMWKKDNNSKKNKLILCFKYSEHDLQTNFNYYTTQSGRYNTTAKGNKIVMHFQPHFYDKENELLQLKLIRDHILTNRETILKKPYYKMTLEEIYRGFKASGTFKGYSHFSPLWFKAFIDEYNIKTCYDPCGGWGHRLLGAQKLEKYIYNDAWDKTYNGVNEMIKQFNITNTITYNNDCSTFTPEESYEAIFTCPPYYNLELYDEKNKFKSEDHFKEWWDNTMQHALKSETKVLGIVTDNFTINLLQPIIEKYMKFTKQDVLGASNISMFKQYLTVFTK